MNYQKELEKTLKTLVDTPLKRLLLHSCCAPCSSYVLEYLSDFFAITIYYYNPNIFPQIEYNRRLAEQIDLIKQINPRLKNPISFIEGDFEPQKYYDTIEGNELDLEGSQRCFLCYELRLREAVKLAKSKKFDYFTTTLSISPHKNSQKLNEIGEKLQNEYGVNYLFSDFKKREGYKRSLQLSTEFGLYRQDYCGCKFSMPK